MGLQVRILCYIPLFLLYFQIGEVNTKGICLYFSEKKASWFDALIECQKHHMCLADLNTEVTLGQMETKFNHEEIEYWFGLNSHEKSNYRYASNNKSIEYSPKHSKLVNDGRCAFVKHENGFYKFESADCNAHKRFICTKTDECDGVSMKPGKSKCVITEEEKSVVAY
ncbi:lithostathine-1-alpha [Drosophila rhopaloa]|uniref:Lithostathine-1-alpha n=1 Tax=Drosophila rhopaloa TaxID=1041015 RepID=A0A6P4EBF5_DRORH|nr:lithostathine-1-alpha [Drosophila rhopaloa]